MKQVGLTGFYHRSFAEPEVEAVADAPAKLTVTCDFYDAPQVNPSVLRMRLRARQESLDAELAAQWSLVMDHFNPSATLAGSALLQTQSSRMRYHLVEWLRTRYVMQEVHAHIATLLRAANPQNAAQVQAAVEVAPKYLGPVYQSADPWTYSEADLAAACERAREYAEIETTPVKPPLKRR